MVEAQIRFPSIIISKYHYTRINVTKNIAMTRNAISDCIELRSADRYSTEITNRTFISGNNSIFGKDKIFFYKIRW